VKQTMRRALVGAVSTALAVPAMGLATTSTSVADELDDYQVLVVGKTLGFRHSSIDEATRAIVALGQANGFTVDVWDDRQSAESVAPATKLTETPFTAAGLEKYETVVFVSTVDGTNNLDPARPTLLNTSETAAYQGYIRAGGGYVGIHAATDTMHTVPWYGQLTGGGARFVSHPAQQNATMVVEDPTHPSTEHLPREWNRFDEWYNYTTNPRADVHTLITLDESTYNPGRGAMGADHPLSWCQNFEGGRSWYEGAGHTEASYVDPAFLQHLLGGIEWTAGVAGDASDCVSFHDVSDLFDELVADDRLNERVAATILDRLERAQRYADKGNENYAISYVEQAIARANNQIKGDADDLAVRAEVVELLEDLAQWQRDVDEPAAL
jgi:type 1 glutamine amidotransferase